MVMSSTTYRRRIYERYASRFQDAAPTFDAEAAERWGRAYRWYFRGWLPADRDAAVLDVACGGGRLLHFFRGRGYAHVTGVDVSPEQAALARQVGAAVHEADALEFLEANPGEFDLICGLDIIEHFQKDEVLRFLDGCYHALRDGGRVILQTPNASTPWGTHYRYGDFTHETCFQADSLARLLQLCGFCRPEVREQGPIPWGYSGFATLRWCLWQGIRCGLRLYNLAETGAWAPSVLTRVFLASAVK